MPQDVHFDFSAALLLLTLATGLVAALERFVLRPRRQEGGAPPFGVETSVSFFPVLLFVLLLRSFIVEPFRIPSGSMLPTLEVGDFILVNKFAYGLKMPALHTTLLPLGEPERGDIAVFRFPHDPSKEFIKRVVGLPGDTLLYRDKTLYINGEAVPQEAIGPYVVDFGGRSRVFERRLEALPERPHEVLIGSPRAGRSLQVQVPEGSYFVMGDNRDGSDDSRRWGFVPERALVGRAFMIWMSWNPSLGRPDWARIGRQIP